MPDGSVSPFIIAFCSMRSSGTERLCLETDIFVAGGYRPSAADLLPQSSVQIPGFHRDCRLRLRRNKVPGCSAIFKRMLKVGLAAVLSGAFPTV